MSASPSLFIIEDDSLLRGLFIDYFSLKGYVVQATSNSNEALSILSQKNFDFIITDLQISGSKSGIEFLNHLKVCLPQLQIIVCSGNENELKKIKPHVLEVFLKPCDLDEIHAIISACKNSPPH